MNQNKPSKNSPNVKPTILSQQFSGPIPPASELERYEQIMPGLADRIMKQAELEQSERHKNQRSLIEKALLTPKYNTYAVNLARWRMVHRRGSVYPRLLLQL